MNTLNEEVKEFKSSVNSLREQFRTMSTTITTHRGDIATLKEKLKDTEKSLDVYAIGFSDKIKNQIKTELIELSKRATLIRDKKNGKT